MSIRRGVSNKEIQQFILDCMEDGCTVVERQSCIRIYLPQGGMVTVHHTSSNRNAARLARADYRREQRRHA